MAVHELCLHQPALLPPFLRPGWMLQRFESVENQQSARLSNVTRQTLAFIPGRSCGRICVAEPAQRLIDEQVGRGCSVASALTVKRPAVDALSAVIIVARHASLQPVVD